MSEQTNFANELRKTTAAVKIKHRKMGTKKALHAAQREKAADVFGADKQAISAAKKLISTRHKAFRKVTSVRNLATEYWRSVTTPYTEPGVRLIRQSKVNDFNAKMAEYRQQLMAAVDELQEVYGEMKSEAQSRLGELYDHYDYPIDLRQQFDLEWEFPSVDPNPMLKQLNPALYEQEQARIAARFDEAVRLAEEAFAVELAELVNHLCDRLAGGNDGKPKTFRDTAVDNLQQFFERFKLLNISSNKELDNLVEQAKAAVAGATPELLRKDASVREAAANGLASVREKMDELMIARPRRLIGFEEDEDAFSSDLEKARVVDDEKRAKFGPPPTGPISVEFSDGTTTVINRENTEVADAVLA